MDSHVRLLVENILKHPREFSWSVQGLGMMRTYLSQAVRLHIWDSALRIPGVSAIHSHPWDLQSVVVAGRYRQHRYVVPTWKGARPEEFNLVRIQCGEHACTVGEPQKVFLEEQPLELYLEGDTYAQTADEIHLSCPEDGTVTLVTRTFKDDRDHANVLWRGIGGWVDAKPRAATVDEVEAVTRRSLQTWFAK